METEETIRSFQLGQHVDALDTINVWLDAEVIAIEENQIKIHFTGWSQKYDEWIKKNSDRIKKQWAKFQSNINIGNRLDVKHPIGGWLEAKVIEINQQNPNIVKVHFAGYKKKYDIEVDVSSDQVAEIGKMTGAPGNAQNYNSANIYYKQLEKKYKAKLIQRENVFLKELKDQNIDLRNMEGDGNCLFRSISDQIYATDQFHIQIRQYCIRYIRLCKDFFQNYIVEGNPLLTDFDKYTEEKIQEGTWGDDIQIQAISQIYNVPIEVYAYSLKPMRTFHQDNQNKSHSLKISYHGQSHYNSLRFNSKKQFMPYLTKQIGVYQEAVLEEVQKFKNRPDCFNEIIEKSRQEFQKMKNQMLETALKASMEDYELRKQQQKDIQQAIKQSIQDPLLKQILINTEDQHFQNILQNQEEIQFKRALKLSVEEDQAMLNKVLEESRMQEKNRIKKKAGVQKALMMGFPEWSVLMAYQQVGQNSDLIIQHIIRNSFE